MSSVRATGGWSAPAGPGARRAAANRIGRHRRLTRGLLSAPRARRPATGPAPAIDGPSDRGDRGPSVIAEPGGVVNTTPRRIGARVAAEEGSRTPGRSALRPGLLLLGLGL